MTWTQAHLTSFNKEEEEEESRRADFITKRLTGDAEDTGGLGLTLIYEQ